MAAPNSTGLMPIDIVTNIILFFALSGLVIPLLHRLKVSPVLGYLVCGMIVGPYGLARLAEAYPFLSYVSLDDLHTAHVLGELGIIALLFMIGLELSLERLIELRKYIFGLGSLQILVSAIAISGIAFLFDNSMQAVVLIGLSFALSSTAIVMKLLEEERLHSTPIGILCFAILLMQDLAVVPMLVLASSLSGGAETSIALSLLKSFFVGGVTVVAIYIFGRKIISPLLRTLSFSTAPEWLTAFVVFTVLLCSVITYIAGMSLALGGFVAGLLASETEFKHEIEVIIKPVKSLLLGAFFLSVGMMIDVAAVINQPLLLAASVLGLYCIKAMVTFLLSLAFKVSGRNAIEAGIYLAQPGEFALMILGVAVSTNLMPISDIQFFLLVTVIGMFMTPLLFKLAPLAGQRYEQLFGKKEDDGSLTLNAASKKRVVIAGFGRVGESIAKVLEHQHIPYIAFDNDGDRIKRGVAQNYPVVYGDATKKDLWKNLLDEHVEVAVIATNDHDWAVNTLKTVRKYFPLLPVIVRSRDLSEHNELYDEGATLVVAETMESSLRIAKEMLDKLGGSAEHNEAIIAAMRQESL